MPKANKSPPIDNCDRWRSALFRAFIGLVIAGEKRPLALAPKLISNVLHGHYKSNIVPTLYTTDTITAVNPNVLGEASAMNPLSG